MEGKIKDPLLKSIVINQGEINRRTCKGALLLKLGDELKAGNLSVRYSKRLARLEEFFIDDRSCQGMRKDFFRPSGLPAGTGEMKSIPLTEYFLIPEVSPNNFSFWRK